MSKELPTPVELQNLILFLTEQFHQHAWIPNQRCPLVLLGGTARNLAKMHQRKIEYTFSSLHYYQMQATDLESLFQYLCGLSIQKRRSVPGLSKDRADIIIAGLAVFRTLLQVTKSDQLITSNKGLRDGVLFERVLHTKGLPKRQELVYSSAQQFMWRYGVHIPHSFHVAKLSVQLFDEWNLHKMFQLGVYERRILEIAALLHDVGRSVNVYESSLHTFYLLTNVLLLGLNHRERVMVAIVASYKNNKQVLHQIAKYEDLVHKEDKPLLEQLGQILQLAQTLDFSMTQKITGVKLLEQKKKLYLECLGNALNELEYTLVEEVLEKMKKTWKRTLLLPAPSL